MRARQALDAPHFPNAACRPKDTSPEAQRAMWDLFFGVPGERPARSLAREAEAKAICNGCPELHDCRTWALANSADIGDDAVAHDSRKSETYVGQIIGGLNLRDRLAIRDGRPQPAPRLRLLTEPDTYSQLGKPLAPIRHGTVSGMTAHYRRNDLPPCDACKAARAEYRNAKRAAQRQTAG